jgi:hypothetical protein
VAVALLLLLLLLLVLVLGLALAMAMLQQADGCGRHLAMEASGGQVGEPQKCLPVHYPQSCCIYWQC